MHLAKYVLVVVYYIKMSRTAKEQNQMKHNKTHFFCTEGLQHISLMYEDSSFLFQIIIQFMKLSSV